ncbi:hypothetical protein [Flavivirga spongiicola]|uniref:LPXTG cell wall anchor domain-containing protein n=1 Tax=Flavivirga spongiicola TaxID=421621 RepID=A0ABU7XY57_9FLAO|nr:hypothetical protein [Flavivirga sp. MEBiC05379]MDO5980388.1 hypothetical protein [Flavivirga sp. MEBiC05379]
MILNYLTFFLRTPLLMNQSDIVTILIIVVVVFSILLILGVRKSYKLKKENERLNNMNTKMPEEEDETYKDFTDGHMYDNK